MAEFARRAPVVCAPRGADQEVLSERGRRIGLTLFFAVLLSSVALLSVTFHQDANTPEEPPRREPAPPVARTIADEPATPAAQTDAVEEPGPDLAALSAGVREAIEEDDGGTYGVALRGPQGERLAAQPCLPTSSRRRSIPPSGYAGAWNASLAPKPCRRRIANNTCYRQFVPGL